LVSLHQKTAKAIRSKKGSIEEGLIRLQQNTSITNDIKSRELLDMIRATLHINGSYCCRCNKSLSKTEVKQCNGCRRMSYCSRTCQREDWLNGGHSVTCCKTYTPGIIVGQFQGRLVPELVPENERAATKMKELETNLNMIQLNLFLCYSDTILNQVEALDIPLYDCVVQFNLCECPPTAEVAKCTWLTPEQKKGFEETRSKENIMCVYASIFHFGDSKEVY